MRHDLRPTRELAGSRHPRACGLRRGARLALAALTLMSVMNGARAEGVLEVISIKGKVTVGDTELVAGTRYQIAEGSRVTTDSEGNLFARFTDGSLLRLKEDSILHVAVIEPAKDADEDWNFRSFELEAGALEYLADPSATVDLAIHTVRGTVTTRDADVAVRVDAYQGETELACVIVHNVDHTSRVEGDPEVIITVLKEDVDSVGKSSAVMNPGSILLLCPRMRRNLEETSRHAIEDATDAVPIVTIEEASPFRLTEIFDF